MLTRGMLISIAGALGLALCAIPASAQDYSPYVTPGFAYGSNAPEEVIVTPPPYQAPEYNELGVPDENVALSRPVRFDDLDLTSDWGVRALQARIRYTARALCNRLDFLYPVSANSEGGSWPTDTRCYRRALDRAMYQANAAIRSARSGYGYER